MKTVGSMLRESRKTKGLTLEQVERATKIRKKFLEAIERDDYTKLPSVAYAKGFVQNYSDFLGMDRNYSLAIFRRQTKEVPKSALLPKKEDARLSPTILRMTPRRFLVILIGGLVAIFTGYLIFQYASFQKAPTLTIDAPKENAVTQDRRIDLLGKTDPDVTVVINGMSVLVRSDGKFFDQVVLVNGVNTITVTATSRFGKTTTLVRDVGYQP